MRGYSSARRIAATDNHRTAPRYSPLPPRGGVPLKRAIRSILVCALVVVMLMPALSSLPTTVQQLSPAGSAHASNSMGPAGEGPTTGTRSVSGTSTFLDIEPAERILGIDPDGKINAIFIVEERNNLAATISSYTYRVLYLDDTILIPYNGQKAVDVTIDGLGKAEVTVLGSVPGTVTFDLMKRGIDKLKMDVTFRGKDANDNAYTLVVRAPLHILQRVAMIVDEDVYPLIKDNMARYEQDVNLKTKVEFITVTDSWDTPEEVRNALKGLWTEKDITGAILWGYLPIPMWSMVHSDNSTEDFPIPIFYEDMDGSFEDLEGDGLYDRHYWGQNDGPEIWVSHVMPPRPLVPSTNLDPRGLGTGGGLVGNYYNSGNMQNFKLTRVDPMLDFYWIEDLPEEIDNDDFSIQWTGRIKADVTDQYTISPQHGGIAKIWIDGNLVHNRNFQTWNITEWLFDVYLTKGWHSIRIEYSNNNWGFTGATRLLWTSDTVLANTINEWLDKTHAYHNGVMDYNERALLFMDYGYGTVCRMAQPILNRQIEPLYGDNVVVKGLVNTTSADDYIDALEDGYELVSVWSHSGSAGHQINAPARAPEANTTAPSWRIRETEANVVTLIWGCHAGNYGNKGPGTSLLSDNLAVNYAFATPNGLASAAATRSIGTTFKNVYWAWDNGSSLATGFLANLEEEYDKATIVRTVPNLAQDKWVKDMVLLGDPFVTIDHRPWGLSVEIDGGSEFTTESQVTLHLSAMDAEEMRFKSPGSDWTPWETFAPTKEWTIGEGYGAHRVMFQTRNDWGQARFPVTDIITIVSTLVDSVSVEINEGAEATSSNRLSLSIDLGGADGSLVMMTLQDDGSEWSDWAPYAPEQTWTLSEGDGERSVRIRVVEVSGIMSAEAEDTILLDTRPPKTVATVTGEMGIGQWYVSVVTIGLEAVDVLSDVDRIEWNLDDGDWVMYDAPIIVSEDGNHVVNFRSSDTLGNVEGTDQVSFMIDISGPEGLQFSLVDGKGIVNLPTVNLKLTATDLASGLDSMRFRIDDGIWGQWMTFQDTFFLSLPESEGTYIISFAACDFAGIEAICPETLVVVLDRTSPTVVVTDPVDEQEKVPVDQTITVEVSEAIEVSTLTRINFLLQDGDGLLVTGKYEFNEDERTITFTTDETLEHYTTYSVMMRGEIIDSAGNQLNGGTGHMWTFTTEGALPDGPTGVSAVPQGETIMVSWDTVPATYSGDLMGYNVYRMTDDGAPGRTFEFLATTSSTSFIDEVVEVGVSYHYQITAFTTCGEGEVSSVASAIIAPHVDEPEEPIDDPEDPEPVDIEPPVLNAEPDKRYLGTSAGVLVLILIIGAVVAAVLFVMKGRKM